MKIKFIFILISLFPVFGFSGGTTVRNGGGLGEMSAVMIFQKMEKYLRPCFKNTAVCELSDKEATILNQVLKSLEVEQKSYNLSFFVAAHSLDVVTEPKVGEPIRIRSGALADSEGNPKSFSQIGALILYGLLLHQEYDSQALAEKVFRNMKVQLNSFLVGGGQLQWFRVQFLNESSLDEVILEQSHNSYDLAPFVAATGLCGHENQITFQISRISMLNVALPIAILDINWSCGGNKFGKAKIELNLAFKADSEFDPTATKARAFGVLRP